jgi:4-amino-4-deoxy-L-arabinose transferase-like glycosyltransferase
VRRSVLTLLLLSLLTFFFGLGRQAITDSDEGYYAEASREMVESGDWLTPHFNYADRWQKPVLYYWLTAATYTVVGVGDGAARFWSAAAGLGLVLITWGAARRMTGDHAAAWLAGAIVATCYGYFAMARMALPDLPLAFCVTLCLVALFDNRWPLAGFAAGLGFLMKGPVALVVPALVILPVWWREGRFRRLAARTLDAARTFIPRQARDNPERSRGVTVRDLAIAALIFAVVGLPWYVAMTYTHGAAYLQSFIVGDNLERFATDRFNEPRGIWFYVPIVIGGMVPWSIYMLVLPWRSVGDVVRRRRRLTAEEWRLLLWLSLPLLFFTASIGKQPRYILPVLPPLAILVARSITTRLTADSPYGDRGIAIATWCTAALYVTLALLLWRARPLFISAYPLLSLTAVAAIGGAGVLFAALAAARRWHLLPAVGSGCAVALLLSVQFGALAGIRPEPVEQMAALVAAQRRGGERVGEYQVFVRNLVFYAGFAQEELYDEERALGFVKSSERVLLVISEADLPRLESVAGVALKRLGEVRYLNTANLKFRTLVWPLPDQDLETVLLVTNR